MILMYVDSTSVLQTIKWISIVVPLWTDFANLVIFEEIQYYQELTNSRDTALLLLALWGPFPNDVNFELRP